MPFQMRVQGAFGLMEFAKCVVGAVQRVAKFIDARTDLQIGQGKLVSSSGGNPLPAQGFVFDAHYRVTSNPVSAADGAASIGY